jgi:hypothetical protein
MLTILHLLPVAAALLVPRLAIAAASSPAPASPGPPFVRAPCEYKWTVCFRQYHYGIEQYGPVATYRRNTLLIWRNQAHVIPVTVPGLIVIVGMVVALPLGLFYLISRSPALRSGKDEPAT